MIAADTKLETQPAAEADPWAAKQQPDTTPDQVERWTVLRELLVSKAKSFGWTKTQVSTRSSVPQGTLWTWLDGTYKGNWKNINDRVDMWLASIDELSAAAARVPTPPAFVETPTSKLIMDALLYAQSIPEIATVVISAGMGKTMTVERYVNSRPNAFRVVMRPMTRTMPKMMKHLAEALDLSLTDRMPSRVEKAIGDKLRRNGRQPVLVIDEAQHLNDDAVNQLRYFHDEFHVGLALVGNEEFSGRFGSSPQLQSRFGFRIDRRKPADGDVEAIMAAWEVTDPNIIRLAMVIAQRPGSLRNITKTMQLASIVAAGHQRELTAADFKLAAANRGLDH